MRRGHWYRLSGDQPDLDLRATELGTRYLEDGDPAGDVALNPPRNAKERLRRLLGRRPFAPWQGRAAFPAITEAWNGAVYASRFGPCGAMTVYGGGHDDYFGSDVHAFDVASRQWSRISDGYVAGDPDRTARERSIRSPPILTALRSRRTLTTTFSTTPSGMTFTVQGTGRAWTECQGHRHTTHVQP